MFLVRGGSSYSLYFISSLTPTPNIYFRKQLGALGALRWVGLCVWGVEVGGGRERERSAQSGTLLHDGFDAFSTDFDTSGQIQRL